MTAALAINPDVDEQLALPPRGHRRSKSASDRVSDDDPPARSDAGMPQKDRKISAAAGGAGCSPEKRMSLENMRELQLHLQHERSIRSVLNGAISPGQGHLSNQTRDLIAEIEQLEEEIANREQHVLALYRSIFDQCVSAPSSAQSSGVASPAHARAARQRRNNQSVVVSGSFCSSRSLGLKRPPHALVPPATRAGGGGGGGTKAKQRSFSDETFVRPLVRTLRDHLYQNPNKIAEEMVRCMTSLYCLIGDCSLRKTLRSARPPPQPPCLPRSATTGGGGRALLPTPARCAAIEVSSIAVEKSQLPEISCLLTHYRFLVEQLECVDLSGMEVNAKMAFWINVFNALVMHTYVAYGVPTNSLRRMALFYKAAYNIAGHAVTAHCIEHLLLGCRSQRSGRWYESILSTAMRRKFADEKLLTRSNLGVSECEPLVLFTLCTGAASDPMLKVYSAKNIVSELQTARKEFLQANVAVGHKVFLPRNVDRYAKEASLSDVGVLSLVSDSVDAKVRDAIRKCTSGTTSNGGSRRRGVQVIEWLPHNTSFRYTFAKSLVEGASSSSM